ncbi:GGDEF domain-containing protein [Eleftheria terrae]|uniref:GGDEF domain-containing protein n=1 Tax=Eleftheria terrae TaxID=1597781 RepID=UPI00263A962F|nr:GGDEF domain-containing protein [Eleftheria terrae]WKB52400.1 GGDEF domain-containing protein [Eleftheria terrae]
MDFSIVAITGSVLGFLLAVLLGLAIRWVPDAEGARYWALAFVPLSLGSALVGRGEALPALLLVLREPLLLSGYGLLLIGLRHYLRLSRPWALAGSVVLASLVVTALFTALLPSVTVRMAVRTTGIALLTGAALWTLRSVTGPTLREVRLYLQVGFGTIAVLALLRAAMFLLPLPFTATQVMQLYGAASMVTTITIMAVVTGLALLMTARMNEALAQLTVRDPLTGVFNRRGLEEAVPGTLSFARRVGRPVAVLSCDLDHFKAVNDTYGHAEGDRVLQALGRLLGEHFAQAGLVGRLGGEEFVVLLPGADGEQGSAEAERLRAAIEAHRFERSDGGRLELTASIGVAAQPGEEAHWETLLARADQALYQAKAGGRNRCALAPEEPTHAAPAPPAPGTPAGPWLPAVEGGA